LERCTRKQKPRSIKQKTNQHLIIKRNKEKNKTKQNKKTNNKNELLARGGIIGGGGCL
jgi:hypothetical protein